MPKFKNLKWLLLIVIAVAALVWIGYLTQPPRQTVAPSREKISQEDQSDFVVKKDYVKYFGRDGKNAFELLQAVAPAEYKQYDFGVFVQSINGVKPDSKHFWKLYFNGQESRVGADKLETKKGDVIEWKMEEIR